MESHQASRLLAEVTRIVQAEPKRIDLRPQAGQPTMSGKTCALLLSEPAVDAFLQSLSETDIPIIFLSLHLFNTDHIFKSLRHRGHKLVPMTSVHIPALSAQFDCVSLWGFRAQDRDAAHVLSEACRLLQHNGHLFVDDGLDAQGLESLKTLPGRRDVLFVSDDQQTSRDITPQAVKRRGLFTKVSSAP